MEKKLLREKWQQYSRENIINYSTIQDKELNQFPIRHFEPNETMVMRGDFPSSVYFILNGVVLGVRNYENGNEYSYFQLGKNNGSVGLLEVLAQKEEMIATITCLTKVEAVQVPSTIVYDWIMQDMDLLRLSINLLASDLYARSGNDGLLYRYEGVDRLRFFLISYYEEHACDNQRLEVTETREKIANTLGMSIRTVGRSLLKLRQNQEIMNEKRKIYLGEDEYQRLKKAIHL
uniref:Crp/Fnr family transcriptional regulator n=1 Tax=Candidatus Enterococcus willemsii TaxID=1857215 RepID=UPI00403F3F26